MKTEKHEIEVEEEKVRSELDRLVQEGRDEEPRVVAIPVASDGSYTIGTVGGCPAQWDGNMEERPLENDIMRRRENDTFGVDYENQYIVRNDVWEES